MAYTQYTAEIHAQLTALLEDASSVQTIFAHALRIEADLLASSVASQRPQRDSGAPDRRPPHHPCQSKVELILSPWQVAAYRAVTCHLHVWLQRNLRQMLTFCKLLVS